MLKVAGTMNVVHLARTSHSRLNKSIVVSCARQSPFASLGATAASHSRRWWNYLLDVTDPAGSARFIQNCTQSSADSGFIAVTAVQGIDYCAGFEHI
jgi:hypothetical protein